MTRATEMSLCISLYDVNFERLVRSERVCKVFELFKWIH